MRLGNGTVLGLPGNAGAAPGRDGWSSSSDDETENNSAMNAHTSDGGGDDRMQLENL